MHTVAPLTGAARHMAKGSHKREACSIRSYSSLMTFSQQQTADSSHGSLDGHGAADHDEPYRFGSRPRASVPYPFNTRQYVRLLILRSRLKDHLGEADQNAATSWHAAAA